MYALSYQDRYLFPKSNKATHLQTTEYSQVIKCPECREVTILDDSGVEGLESFPYLKKETYDDFESPRGVKIFNFAYSIYRMLLIFLKVLWMSI